MNNSDTQKLGEPDLKMLGFKLWIHGRQFPESDDFWDGNWLNITAYCGESGANVLINGPYVSLNEIAQWKSICNLLYQELTGEEELRFIEPNLNFQIRLNHGKGYLRIFITPDQLNQSHWFEFEVDQSHLYHFISDCNSILKKFPINGESQFNA